MTTNSKSAARSSRTRYVCSNKCAHGYLWPMADGTLRCDHTISKMLKNGGYV